MKPQRLAPDVEAPGFADGLRARPLIAFRKAGRGPGRTLHLLLIGAARLSLKEAPSTAADPPDFQTLTTGQVDCRMIE
jgi:hypothetical protein